MRQYISNARKPKHLIPQHMRIPLITPLASRNGAVEKDEKLVNCYGEQDVVTKETRVIKRAGLAPGNAVLSGPDIYGQGLFNYDGYWFTILGDTVFYGDVNFNIIGQQAFGAVGFWDSGTTYNLNDPAYYNGLKYYSAINGNIGNAPPSQWNTAPLNINYGYFNFNNDGTLSNGNLTFTQTVSGLATAGASLIVKSSGSWYFEITLDSISTGSNIKIDIGGHQYSFFPPTDVGAVIGVRYEGGAAPKRTKFYKNDSLIYDQPNSVSSGYPGVLLTHPCAVTANFGQSSFVSSVPSGFNAGWYEVA